MNHEATKSRSVIALDTEYESVAREIVDSAFQVHSTLGPGLLESFYEQCFCIALKKKNINFEKQKPLNIEFLGDPLPDAYRLDLFVENKIVVELKAVEKIMPLHEAQLLSYMKLAKSRLGFLINFNVPLIKDGIKRRAL